VPALRGAVCPVHRGDLRADRLGGPPDPDHAPPPGVRADLPLPGPRGDRRPAAPPPPPKAITGGRFTTGFLARLLAEKFVLARPAHRIAAALSFDGLEVADGTLAGVFAALEPLLAPLAAAITERNAAAGHLHADESRWNVFAATGGKDSHRWWLTCIGPLPQGLGLVSYAGGGAVPRACLSVLPAPDSCRVLPSGGPGQGARSARVAAPQGALDAAGREEDHLAAGQGAVSAG